MNPRVLLGAGIFLAALVVGIVVLVTGGSKDDSGDGGNQRPVRAQLTLERAVDPEAGSPELIVSLREQRLNTLDTTDGEASVLLRCVNKRGGETVRQMHDWPLEEEVGFSPHVHQPIRSEVLDDLRSCRMTGKTIYFTARVKGRIPPFSEQRTSR